MERLIVGYHRDDQGDWVAHLACGHRQHVRHRPLFEQRPWVLEAAGRRERLGTPLACPRCDRAELPELARLARRTPSWDESSMPERLRQDHRLAPGTWAEVVVEQGDLVLASPTLGDPPPLERKLVRGERAAVPPDVPHHVDPLGAVRFHLVLYQVDPVEGDDREGAEPAGARPGEGGSGG